jgi:hypothetical protein
MNSHQKSRIWQREREMTEEEEELATARLGCSVPLRVACIYKGSKKNTL